MHAAKPAPSLGLIGLLAITAGATVANLYYCQPILGMLATQFGASEHSTSMLVSATQLGYAASLLLVVPLGDMFERRKLIILTVLLSSVVLVFVGLAPGLSFMLAGSFLLGAASVTPQLVVPYTAGLVEGAGRGRLLGVVMSGLLVGILLSRTLSGLLSAVTGWRAVYGASAVLMLGLAWLLKRSLPPQQPHGGREAHYGKLLGSLWAVLRKERVLQQHSMAGACVFAAFSVFWTTLAFHLASLPGHYGSSTAGLFGLFGAAGALAAPLAGRLSDRYDPRAVNRASLCLVIAAFLCMRWFGGSLPALALAVVLMDAGVQASHISNQTRIFSLSPALRSRINSVYMVCYFLGGATGSVVGSWAWAAGGWGGVCLCGAAFATLGLVPLLLPSGERSPTSNPVVSSPA